MRSSIRAELRQQGIDDRKLKVSTEEDFPPPLCNRMGVNWRKTTNDCSCKKWPEWVRRNLGVTAACKQQREPITDSAGNEGVVIRGVKLMYWRVGAQSKQWWYNGSASECFSVRFPTGKTKDVVALN